MDAFLLSAGLGTRLRPLTDTKPKALVELGSRPLIDRNLECLKKIGCSRVIINTSYLAQQVIDYVGDGSQWDLEVIFSYEQELLETGGGIKNVLPYVKTEKFILWNADVYIDPNFCLDTNGFGNLKEIALSSRNPLLSLLVKKIDEDWEDLGKLKVNGSDELVSFLGVDYLSDTKDLTKVMYCGISIIDKAIAKYFPSNLKKFSITKDIFPKILADTNSIGSKILVSYCNHYWNDIGTPKGLMDASNNLK